MLIVSSFPDKIKLLDSAINKVEQYKSEEFNESSLVAQEIEIMELFQVSEF